METKQTNHEQAIEHLAEYFKQKYDGWVDYEDMLNNMGLTKPSICKTTHMGIYGAGQGLSVSFDIEKDKVFTISIYSDSIQCSIKDTTDNNVETVGYITGELYDYIKDMIKQ